MPVTYEDFQDRQTCDARDDSLAHGSDFAQIQRHKYLVQLKVDSFASLDTAQFDAAILVDYAPPIVCRQSLEDFLCVPGFLSYNQIMLASAANLELFYLLKAIGE